MAPFVATNKAPGVYIEEVQVPGPIAGVGTSTAAFIGPAERGPLNRPTFLTNFTQFQNTFGGYIFAPTVYVTHAVRGFFDNGGTTCYFVRVGTAAPASGTLADRAGTPQPTLVVTAKQEGVAGNAIAVEVQDAHIISSVNAFRESTTLSGSGAQNNQAIVTDGSNFRPGDIVLVDDGTNSERATIANASNTTIAFQTNLTRTYASGSVRIADLIPGQRTIRVASTTGIEPGTYISIAQGTTTESGVVQSVERTNNFITLTRELTQTYTMASTDALVTLQSLEFTLIVTTPSSLPDAGTKTFANLSIDPRHSRYFAKIVDSKSVEVMLADPSSPSLPPNNLPAVLVASVLGGQDDDITQIQPTHYSNAIDELEKVDDVDILCIPDRTDQEIQVKMISHCEKMQDRFAILDPQLNATPDPTTTSGGIGAQRNLVNSDRGFAALYYPWISISNPVATGQIKVPPSGHIAGVYARTDTTRGVHKAPANEPISGVLSLERTLTDDEQGPLNEKGINVLRSFPGSGIRVWGARTIAPHDITQWRYINVRRLLLFIEESIQEGTRFAVFEPNNLALWAKVKRQVTEFLTRVWRDGALFGATPDQAFRVRVDEELNPPTLRALGQLVIEVIVFPVTPAEFIVFRIIQKPGGGRFDEL
jgi:uncharacterized protein